MLLIDAVMRLVPDVLGDETSARYESFAEEGVLEYPQYTRPREFRGMSVPEVLLNGNHQEIERWRRQASLERTCERRPADLSHESAVTLPVDL
jgi:tRNA (guanine37-N1)-methyltransferase